MTDRQKPPEGPMDSDGPPVDPETLERQRALGARLKTMFDDVVHEDVPDDFMALLDRLEKQGPR